MTPRVVFFAPPSLTSLDLIGPLQAFQFANSVFKQPYEIEVCAITETLEIVGNLQFSNLIPYQDIELTPNDILFVSGCWIDPFFTPESLKENKPLFEWIYKCWQSGATICSVCTGAFLLAEAGVLDGSPCATHWAEADQLQRLYPKLNVKSGILFTNAGNVYTSAGIASGIDLAIHILGLRHGQKLAFEIARFLVVYLRRNGNFEQESIYLQYRNHMDDVVHRAQNILIEKLDTPPTLDLLAEEVGASARNLSRRFRKSIGITVGEYLNKLRLERAQTLLQEEGSKVQDVAKACGFSSSRQLRNLFRQHFGHSPRSPA